ncbi:MAG: hypothetical protein AAGG09_21735, partial [Pseudomonadota bacterium]
MGHSRAETAVPMPSLFRLYLDHDGISLRRIGASEAELSTTLDAPDFEARLAEMRELIAAETAKAAGGEPDTAPTEVVLPDSQILYTEVAASGLDDVADAARVRAGLVGATPYDLDELLWDWRLDGKVLRIAVVARETLAEAQQFAAAQGFDPTAYLGNPDEDVFPGHPRFGGTAAESAPPDAASALMRDAAQAASAEGDTPESGEPAETSPADPAPLQTAERPVDPEPAPNADMAPTDASATPAENPSPEAAPAGGASGADAPAVPAPVSDNKTAHDAEPAEVAGKGDDSAEAETSPESTVSAEAAAEASESTAPPGAESDGPAETPPAPDTVAAAPFVSLRAARDGADAERTSPVVPASATPEQPTPPKAPARRGLSRLRATASEPKPAKRKDAPSPVASKPVGKQNAGKPNTGKQKVDKQTSVSLADTSQTHDLPPPSNTPKLSTLANASAPETLPPRGKREIRRRSTGLVVPAPAASAPSKEGALNEAESLTVFGARRTESVRGGPRYLGLTLTIGLLAVMGVVALWSLYVEDRGEQAVASLPPATAPSEDASNVAQAIEQTEPEGAIEGADALASTEAAAPPAPTATEPTEIPPAASGQTAEDATDPAPAITPLPEDPTPSTEDVARAQPVETPESPQGADSTSAPVAPAQSVEGTSVAEAPAAPSVATSTAADVPLGDAATPPPVAQPDAPDADTAEAAPAETAPTALPSTPAPAPSADVAATEVLTDTPTSPLAPGASEEPPLTTRALTPPGGPTPAPVRLPDGRLAEADRRDALPTAPVNPLPAGSYLGPDGLVVPLPEGALAPGGYVLFTGRPPIVPPARPSADAPAPTALPDTQDDASLAPGAQTETPEAADPLAVADAAVAPLDPLQDARPLPRPADADAEASASLPVPDAGSQDADGEAVATDISADPSPADEAGSAETVAQPPLAPPATRDAPAEAVLAALSGALAPETTEEALPAPQPADPEPTALPSAPDAEETAAPFAAEADPTSPDL